MIVPVDEITFVQGASFRRSYVAKDEDGVVLDLTGWAARGQMRLDHSSATLLATQTVVITAPLAGELQTDVDAVDTATIEAPEFVGDIEVESPTGFVIRVVKQDFTTDYEVTQ